MKDDPTWLFHKKGADRDLLYVRASRWFDAALVAQPHFGCGNEHLECTEFKGDLDLVVKQGSYRVIDVEWTGHAAGRISTLAMHQTTLSEGKTMNETEQKPEQPEQKPATKEEIVQVALRQFVQALGAAVGDQPVGALLVVHFQKDIEFAVTLAKAQAPTQMKVVDGMLRALTRSATRIKSTINQVKKKT